MASPLVTLTIDLPKQLHKHTYTPHTVSCSSHTRTRIFNHFPLYPLQATLLCCGFSVLFPAATITCLHLQLPSESSRIDLTTARSPTLNYSRLTSTFRLLTAVGFCRLIKRRTVLFLTFASFRSCFSRQIESAPAACSLLLVPASQPASGSFLLSIHLQTASFNVIAKLGFAPFAYRARKLVSIICAFLCAS